MKRFFYIFAAIVTTFCLSACVLWKDDEYYTAEGEVRVAMITDYGDITDRSFNQTTYEACKKWCEENDCDFTYKKPISDADQDRIASMEEAIDDGFNVLVLPGYVFGPIIEELAPQYTDVKFIALDVAGAQLNDNAYSAVYKEEIGGYLAGYCAVKLGYEDLGFLGGMAVPSIIRFGYGYLQGANDAAIEMGKTDSVSVKYVYGGKFYGDAGITARMDTWYKAGTQIVFACGGSIYDSACEAALKEDGKVIGVDVDQAPIILEKYGKDMTVTSAMKGLTETVYTLLDAVKNDEWDKYGGQEQNLGIVSLNPEDNYLQLAPSTQWSEGFTEEDYIELVRRIYDGEIEISNSTNKMPEVQIKVKDEGSMG